MQKKYNDIIKGFVPQFGNENHMYALELMDAVGPKIRALDRLKSEALIKKREKEIDQDLEQIKYLIGQRV